MRSIYTCLLFLIAALAPVYIQAQSSEHPDSIVQNILRTFGSNIPQPRGWVNDFENILTPAEEQALDSLITAYQKQTTVQIAIITIDTLMVTDNNFEPYTLDIANTWGVGDKEKDNGILIGFSSGHRRVRIQNGLGFEKLITNAETKVIVDTAMLPQFKQGNYYQGIRNGLLEMMQLLNERMK